FLQLWGSCNSCASSRRAYRPESSLGNRLGRGPWGEPRVCRPEDRLADLDSKGAKKVWRGLRSPEILTIGVICPLRLSIPSFFSCTSRSPLHGAWRGGTPVARKALDSDRSGPSVGWYSGPRSNCGTRRDAPRDRW